ncbi:MAG: iron-containing alcohol dehydrogenase [Sphaerochaetaceae bacterium]
MYNFTFYAPTKVIFGKKTEDQVGEIVKSYGFHKVLVHYGTASVKRSGLLDKVLSLLDENSIAHVELGGVVPNPRLSLVYQGIELAKKEKVDLILAVGGGSVIDSAKAIGYGVSNPGDVWDFYMGKRKPEACLPVGVILTLAATGSEMSDSSVITNENGALKHGCSSNLSRPLFAIMNPELTMTLPDYQTSCGCTDIIMHTLERWFTQGGNMELTDAIATAVIQTVMEQARILHKDPKCYDARAEVMWAGSLSHNDLTGCGANCRGDWAVHGMEHEIGGLFDVAHGAGLAAIWGSWARYVLDSDLPRFVKLATKVLGIKPQKTEKETALKGIEAMESFFHEIGMPTCISELGIKPTEEDLKTMARKCIEAGGGKKGCAKVLYEPDVLKIYQMADK